MTSLSPPSDVATSPLKKTVYLPSPALLLRLPAFAWLIVLVITPIALLIITGFMRSTDGNIEYIPNLANYAKVIGSGTVRYLAAKTVLVAATSSIMATLVAYPLAFYISRNLRGGKTTAALLIIIPLWISLLMRIFAWRVILGDHGVLNSMLVSSGLIATPSTWLLYTTFSVILTLTSIAIPYVFIAAYTAIERVPFSLVEAARDNGASSFRTFTTVIWPLTRQGTAIGFALGFLMAVGDFVTPTMVGGMNGSMLGMVIEAQFGMAGNWPLGAAMAVYIILLVSLVLGVIFLFTRSRGVLTEVDVGVPPNIPLWNRLTAGQKLARVAGRILFLAPYVYLYAPLVVIMIFSFNDSTVQVFPLSGFTLKWYEQLPSNSAMFAALELSLELAVLVTVLGVVIATAFAFILNDWQHRASPFIESLIALPVALPGVVLGISMVMTATVLRITPGIGRLVLGHLTFVMPVILLVVSSRLRRIDRSFALASRDLGAGWWTTFWRIELPMIRSAIIGGALLGLTMSIDEVMVSLFLTGATPTLPVYVWNQTRFGFTPSVNAIFTCIGLLSLSAAVFGQILITPSEPNGCHFLGCPSSYRATGGRTLPAAPRKPAAYRIFE